MFGILGRKPQSSSQTNLSVGARESESVLTGFTALSNWSKTNALSSKMSSRFSVQKPLFHLWRFGGIAFNLVLAATEDGAMAFNKSWRHQLVTTLYSCRSSSLSATERRLRPCSLSRRRRSGVIRSARATRPMLALHPSADTFDSSSVELWVLVGADVPIGWLRIYFCFINRCKTAAWASEIN